MALASRGELKFDVVGFLIQAGAVAVRGGFFSIVFGRVSLFTRAYFLYIFFICDSSRRQDLL